MPVLGQTPVRLHWEDSDSVTIERVGDTYTDPNDSTKLVQDVMAHAVGAGEIGIVIDGGASSPTTGSKGYLQCPYAGTITGWTILADVSGSCQITVKKCDYSAFPTTTSIVASAPPTLGSLSPVVSVRKATSTSLTGWTTSVSAGDIFEFNLDSVATCKRILLVVQIAKT